MKYLIYSFAAMLQGLVLLLGIALLPGVALAASDTAADNAPRKDMVLKGDATCTRCHDETAEYPVLAIGKTKHGTVADQRTPSCASCHGESETHANKPPDVKERPKVKISFGKKASTPAASQNQACLTCHQGGKRIHWAGSTHANSDTTCTACHQVHTGTDKVLAKATQAETCFACHKEQRAQFNRPSRHPLQEGKVTCSDCHNPHGSAGPKKLVRDNVNDTCYTCHMEKRGPFVRTHQPVQEDCAICHNPHGTTTPNLLKARAPFLCAQCHEASTHQASVATLTAIGTSANTLARGCLNCHTNIHGTNNPANIGNQRTFRR